MKRILSIILLLTALACEKDYLTHQHDFDKSFNAWQAFRQSSGNSYKYTVTAGTWAGASWKTGLVVTQGKVTERQFAYTVFYDVKQPASGWNEVGRNQVLAALKLTAEEFKTRYGQPVEQVLEWKETGNTLGSHAGTSAAQLITLDEVYEKARTEWLVKRAGVSVYFEANNNGLISSCGFVQDGCMDDCFNGINISEIKAL